MHVPGEPAFSDTREYMHQIIARGIHTGQSVGLNEFSSTTDWKKRQLQLQTQEARENIASKNTSNFILYFLKNKWWVCQNKNGRILENFCLQKCIFHYCFSWAFSEQDSAMASCLSAPCWVYFAEAIHHFASPTPTFFLLAITTGLNKPLQCFLNFLYQ